MLEFIFGVLVDIAATVVTIAFFMGCSDDGKAEDHGHWIERNDGWFDFCECSVCHKKEKFYRVYNYCPNCGARMDGGNNENHTNDDP